MLRKFFRVFTVMGMSLLLVSVDSHQEFNPSPSYATENNYQTQDNNSLTKIEFGQTKEGEKADLYTLTNRNGLIAKITNYGAILTKLYLPDNSGELETPGKGDVIYQNHQGLCLETQHFPDSVNQPSFPSVILRPGETYQHIMVHKFDTKQNNLEEILAPNAEVEKVAGGFEFTEGPVWHPDGFLLFSDIPANTIYKWQPEQKTEIFRQPSGNANGNTLDRSGRLITAEHGNRRISLTKKNGQIVTLASHYQERQLNSPNDLAVKSDGSIYFTDPPYGIKSEQEELGFYGVYRLAPDGTLTLLVDDFVRPNGIAFSPDETKLYVNDSEKGHIRVFDVKPDGMLENGKLFAELKPPSPKGAADGMKVDIKGNVYSTGPGGVWIFSPNGDLLGIIETPEAPTNLAWGDRDYKTLYITANTSLYRIRLQIEGMR